MQLIYSSLILISLTLFGFSFAGLEFDSKVKLKDPDPEDWEMVCSNNQLTDLKIKGNISHGIPNCIADLNKLRKIQFTEIDPTVDLSILRDCRTVSELKIVHSDFEVLPEVIGQMTNLRVLNLSGTNIKQLPEGLDFIERIDMRMIELNREEQNVIRSLYPNITILFSSPCQCG